MNEELKNGLMELGVKVKEESENFLVIQKWFWTFKSEIKLLELLRKNSYTLRHQEDNHPIPIFIFEKCNSQN